MMRHILYRIATWGRSQARQSERQSGQSLIILAFAFLGLIAMLGIALDLGLVYIERVRIKRAVDAATLAGVVELPYEDQSFQRALEYLDLNGYDVANANVYVSGCVRDIHGIYGDDTDDLVNDIRYPYNVTVDPALTFTLDTRSYQQDHDEACPLGSDDAFGNSNKLEITGTVNVDMNFMQFFGFNAVPVTDNAVAQNIENLDAVVVFDRSGSMHYDPVCFGCWDRDLTEDDPGYYNYPSNGEFHPITSTALSSEYCFIDPWSGGQNPNGGYPPKSFSHSNRRYIIIEAELYSLNLSQLSTEFRAQGKGYWALQRDGRGSYGLDGRGGYMAHHPERTFYPGTNPYGRFYTLTDAQSGNAPRLEYQFWINRDEINPSWGSQAHLWVRARKSENPQLGGSTDQFGTTNTSTFYWSFDDTSTPGFDSPTQQVTSAQYADLAKKNEWRWVRLTSFPISPGSGPDNLSGPYRLQLWAGSSGIRIDRIIITNNTSNSLPSEAKTHDATPGSAYGEGCDPCNPVYGLTVQDGDCLGFSAEPEWDENNSADLRNHPLWGDWEEPLRSSKEAIKRFTLRLDPEFDQVGLVTFSDSATQDSQLECLSRYGSACYDGAPPYSYTNVLASIESVESAGWTCTACGMRDGLKVLSINVDNEANFDKDCDGSAGSHCGRGGANKVMILITDGAPNRDPNGVCDDEDLYLGGDPQYPGAYDCMIYYARQGRLKGVTIFTIGLGFGVDENILEAVAEEGGGFYRHAASASNLDAIFDEILQTIYVRLIR